MSLWCSSLGPPRQPLCTPWWACGLCVVTSAVGLLSCVGPVLGSRAGSGGAEPVACARVVLRVACRHTCRDGGQDGYGGPRPTAGITEDLGVRAEWRPVAGPGRLGVPVLGSRWLGVAGQSQEAGPDLGLQAAAGALMLACSPARSRLGAHTEGKAGAGRRQVLSCGAACSWRDVTGQRQQAAPSLSPRAAAGGPGCWCVDRGCTRSSPSVALQWWPAGSQLAA